MLFVLSFGSIAKQVIERLVGKPVTKDQPPLVEILSVFHKPPLAPPAKTLLFVPSVGSKNNTLVLPPTLLGPLSIQRLSVPSPGERNKVLSFYIFFCNEFTFCGSGNPVLGFIVNSHCLS